MNKTLALLTCALLITACKPSEKDFISLGEGVVREGLKDPDSAKFNSFYHSSGDSDGYVCGHVNAKNSYGGYTGNKPFFVYIDTINGELKSHGPVTIISDDDGKGLEKYHLFCQ